jgi:hypothetical protein
MILEDAWRLEGITKRALDIDATGLVARRLTPSLI